jgi:glyoxylase-like metal-dependent hydrolase (beta-lactamase superfamily II)
MKLQQFTDHCYAFTGSVNIGYCQKEGKGLLIDAGLDDSAVKKVLKQLKQYDLPLDYCVITHAHADHFGGASFLKKTLKIPLYAPFLEAAIIENPILEPIYLFNGAYPIDELRNKFLEGPPVCVDHLLEQGESSIGPFKMEVIDLPGHSYSQAGILIEEILYAADSYFGHDALNKHIIPFIIDADSTLESLEKLLHIRCKGAIPGHGTFSEHFQETVQENINVHRDKLDALYQLIENKEEGETLEKITKEFLTLHNIHVKNIGQWLLFRTSVTAYIASLIHQGKVRFKIVDNEPKVSVDN